MFKHNLNFQKYRVQFRIVLFSLILLITFPFLVSAQSMPPPNANVNATFYSVSIDDGSPLYNLVIAPDGTLDNPNGRVDVVDPQGFGVTGNIYLDGSIFGLGGAAFGSDIGTSGNIYTIGSGSIFTSGTGGIQSAGNILGLTNGGINGDFSVGGNAHLPTIDNISIQNGGRVVIDDSVDTNGTVSILSGDLVLPSATSSTSGILRKGPDTFLHNYGSDSLFAGLNAGNLTNFGWANTGFGGNTLRAITGAISNTAIGFRALEDLTNQEGNTAVGAFAAMNTTTGFKNTAIGWNALNNNIDGDFNVAVGEASLLQNTNGYDNVSVGSEAMYDNLSGFANTAVGDQALSNMQSGDENVAVGRLAGNLNTAGNRNIFIGTRAGYNETGSDKLYIDPTSTTTPLIKGDFSSNRIDINGGIYANYGNSVGASYGVWGEGSTMGGRFEDTDGTSRMYLGYSNYGAYGGGNSMGAYFYDNDNTGYAYLGYGDRGIWAQGSFAGATFRNALDTGNWVDLASIVSGVNYGVRTPSAVTGSSYPAWSDAKLKENVKSLADSLNKVLQLQGVTFEWKDKRAPGTQLGFIAQDVEKIVPELVTELDGLKLLNYDGLIPLLTESVKELKAEIDILKDENVTLKNELKSLEERVEELEMR